TVGRPQDGAEERCPPMARNAAAEWEDLGMSEWQLAYEGTPTRLGWAKARRTIRQMERREFEGHPIVCSDGKASNSQLLSCVKKPIRNATPVSTRSPPIARSTCTMCERKRTRKAANGSTAKAAMMKGTPSPSE